MLNDVMECCTVTLIQHHRPGPDTENALHLGYRRIHLFCTQKVKSSGTLNERKKNSF